jgi:hypothetical protein
MAKPKVPNTIGDKQYADLQRRARAVEPQMFSRKAVDKRLASNKQRERRNAS